MNSATRPIIREETSIVQKRARGNNFSEGASKEKKSKQNKGTKTKRSQNGSTKAQRMASARWKRKSMQSQKDKGVAVTPSQSSTLSATQKSMQSENKERGKTITSYFRTGKSVRHEVKRKWWGPEVRNNARC